MVSHASSPNSLSSMATRLSRIRLFPDSSHSSKKKPFNYTSSPAKSSKKSMHTAPQQRTRMAHSSAQSQQAGTRQPHHTPYLEHDDARKCPGGARPLPKTPRTDHYQDWHRRDEKKLMESLPRAPLQEVDANARRATPLGPRSQRSSMDKSTRDESALKKKTVETVQAQQGMSEMHSLIDDYLAWNNSSSDLGQFRPASSGTMFVDFASNGEMEVSYRKGVNKKLPVPPLPSKIPETVPSKSMTSHQKAYGERPIHSNPQHDSKQSKPLPPPPQPRHDSGTSCSPEYTEHLKSYISRPLPHPPSQTPRHSTPQGRKTYPPQVHRTQRSSSSSQPSPPPHSSPTLSSTSVSTYHTALSARAGHLEGDAYRVIEPNGMTVNVQPSFRLRTAGSTGKKAISRGYVDGYDPATNYTFDYNGSTMHVHRSPTASRPESWTSEYFDIAAESHNASTCTSSPDLSHYNTGSSYNPAFRTTANCSTSTSTTVPQSKPLPPLPLPGQQTQPSKHGYTRLPEVPRADSKKRRKVFTFVHKVMQKLEELGVMKDVVGHQRRKRHSAPVREKEAWVGGGYYV